tara:strand:- start:438 stop:2060 length:1623 start_codon:yes stop_codon:yes gene_type:complete
MAKKMTYADIAEKLSNAYNKYDSALQTATNDAEKNAATLMLKRVSDRLNNLMLDNQAQANESDRKETAPDSPDQSIAQREMRMMGKGGKLKPVPKGKKGKGLSKLPKSVRNKMGFMKDGGNLKPIPPGNKGLPMLAESVRNNMGYMKKGGSTFPDLTGDGKVTFADILKGRGVFQSGGQLYDGITDEQITQQLLEEAGILSGLGGEFNPRNPEHVKKLQEGLLGGYTGPGADRMLSGTELEFIGPDGPQSVNQAGVDGKFGIDTLTALQQFSEAKNSPVSKLTEKEIVPVMPEIPAVDLSDLKPIATVDPTKIGTDTTQGDKSSEETTGSGKAVNTIVDNLLGPGTKALEYFDKLNLIRGMRPPEDMLLQSPVFLNTNTSIDPQLSDLNDQRIMRERALKQSRTKRQNVDANLAASEAQANRARAKLFQQKNIMDQKNRNMQTMLNSNIEKLNNQTSFDNALARRDFLNDRDRAKSRLFSGIVQDAQDLLTQRTGRRSQEAQLEALTPYLNMYGVMNRNAPQFSDAQLASLMRRLLGQTT